MVSNTVGKKNWNRRYVNIIPASLNWHWFYIAIKKEISRSSLAANAINLLDMKMTLKWGVKINNSKMTSNSTKNLKIIKERKPCTFLASSQSSSLRGIGAPKRMTRSTIPSEKVKNKLLYHNLSSQKAHYVLQERYRMIMMFNLHIIVELDRGALSRVSIGLIKPSPHYCVASKITFQLDTNQLVT